MARGARASSRKRNNAALRAKIFGPAVDARTERLSAKLQELISKPKPVDERAMLVDGEDAEKEGQKGAASINIVDGISLPLLSSRKLEHRLTDSEMEIDGRKTTSKPKHKHHRSKIEKKKKVPRKARNSIIFPSTTRKGNGPGITKAKR